MGMNEYLSVNGVLITVGGGQKQNYKFGRTQMSNRVWKGDDGNGLVGYLLDAQGAEIIKTLTTEQEPQAKEHCDRLIKLFKDAMLSECTEAVGQSECTTALPALQKIT